LKHGRWVAVFYVQQTRPRRWTPEEEALVGEVAERTWAAVERARAEAALRESEEKYRGIFDSIDEGFVVSELLFDDEGAPTDLLVLETNQSFDRMMRTSDAVGKRAREIFPDAEDSWFEAYGHVVEAGESMRFENYLGPLERWFELYVSRIGGAESRRFAIVFNDVTARKRAEEALRESEERQAFLLKLSDALRPLSAPVAIQETASRLLGEYLGVDRVAYGELAPDDRIMTVARDWTSTVTSSVVGEYRIDDFGRFFTDPLQEGKPSVIGDASTDPRVSRPVYESTWKTIGVRSAIAYPLVKQGRFVAALFVHEDDARAWSAGEVSLVAEVGERTWEAIERARAEEALRESEEQYRTLFTSIDEGFCTIEVLFDEQGIAVDYRFLETNPAFERQTGLEDAVGRRVRELAPEHEGFWFEIYGRIARTGEAMRFEHEAAALGRYYDVYAFRIGEPGENRVAIIFNDILTRKRAEEERERLRALEASARAEEAERERISRELHDRVAHHMGVAHQSLELHAALREADTARAEERLRLAAESTRLALDQTRALSAELKRLQEEELEDGLEAAFRTLAGTAVPDSMEVEVSVSGEEPEVPNAIAMQVYLAMREAIRNAVKHSGCSRIGVTLDVGDGEVVGSVEDDGEGFDPEAVGKATPSWGVGMRSMRERAEMLGGSFRIDSKPGAGTRVELRIPLDGRP
jgi:PAS domain S-box-containing protein